MLLLLLLPPQAQDPAPKLQTMGPAHGSEQGRSGDLAVGVIPGGAGGSIIAMDGV